MYNELNQISNNKLKDFKLSYISKDFDLLGNIGEIYYKSMISEYYDGSNLKNIVKEISISASVIDDSVYDEEKINNFFDKYCPNTETSFNVFYITYFSSLDNYNKYDFCNF